MKRIKIFFQETIFLQGPGLNKNAIKTFRSLKMIIFKGSTKPFVGFEEMCMNF